MYSFQVEALDCPDGLVSADSKTARAEWTVDPDETPRWSSVKIEKRWGISVELVEKQVCKNLSFSLHVFGVVY